MFKPHRPIVIIIASLGLFGSVRLLDSQQDVILPVEPITVEDLQAKMTKALTSPEFIEMEMAVVFADDKNPHKIDQRVVINSAMAKDKFLTSVSDTKGVLIAAFSMENKRVQEYRPEFEFGKGERKLKNVVFEYDAYMEEGTDDTYLRTDQDCNFGGNLFSWVTPDNFILRVAFGSIFANTSEPKKEVVEGHQCWVVSESSVIDETKSSFFSTTNSLAIDAQSFLPVRWTTNQTSKGFSLTRTAQIRKMLPGKASANQSWSVDSLVKKPTKDGLKSK